MPFYDVTALVYPIQSNEGIIMIGEKITIQGNVNESPRSFAKFEGDECIGYKPGKTSIIRYRLYPIVSYTGVIANAPYERLLELNVLRKCKKSFANGNFKIGKLREGHDKCPEGYTCKFFEIPVYITTLKKMKERIIWIEHDRY